MNTANQTQPTPPHARREGPVRERLVASASRLFYEVGIHAVSADRIIADVGTTKATFYRHFPTKDDLVVAYLTSEAETERRDLDRAAATSEPHQALAAVAALLAGTSCQAGFRGCPFINAAAEYPDAEHPVRRVVTEQRAWWHGFFATLAQRLGVAEGTPSDTAGGQLMMLRDGALFTGYVDGPQQVADWLEGAMVAVVTSVASPADQL